MTEQGEEESETIDIRIDGQTVAWFRAHASEGQVEAEMRRVLTDDMEQQQQRAG